MGAGASYPHEGGVTHRSLLYRRLTKTDNIDRAEWLEHRRAGIGGSDAAAIVGLNPYSSPLRVWADKMGIAPETETTEAMRQGTDFEGYVAKRFMEETGMKVRRENSILQSIGHPFMLANVDRMVVGERAGLECKTTGAFNKSDWESGEVPNTYYCQCQHYMAVTGYAKWYLAVLVFQRGFYWFEVPRNDDDIAALTKAETQFWNDYVVTGERPDPSGADCDAEVIRAMYADSDVTGEILLTGIDNDLDRLAEIDALSKSLKSEGDAIKQRIQLQMGDAAIATTPKYTVRWPQVSSTRIDTTRIKKEAPDLYQRFAKTSTSRRFTYKKEETA